MITSNLRAILPDAVVSNMMGHCEDTGKRFYDLDVKTMEYKKEATSSYQSSLYRENGATA